MSGPGTAELTHRLERQKVKTTVVQKEGFSAHEGDRKDPSSAVAGELSELFARRS